ncbi:MAG: hybrid sensor histidine kinase/response regulator [Burkholderiales bacterium]
MQYRKRRAARKPLSESKLGALIHAEQISILYRQLPTSIAGNMAGALMLTAVMLAEIPPATVFAWLAGITVFQGTRLVLYFKSRAAGFKFKNPSDAAVLWAAGACLSGAMWGSTAIVFYISGQYLSQSVLTILVFGMTSAAVPMLGAHIPSFYSFVLPALVPFIVRNAYEGDMPHYMLSAITLAITLGLMSFARNHNRMLVESLRNRFEKQVLADRLAAQNIDLEQARIAAEQANRSKTQFFAAASHDLRQPLHAVGLFASALADRVHDPQDAKLVSSINDSVAALETLFNELLDISKLDSGVIQPQLTRFALTDIFGRLRGEFAGETAEKNLRLVIASGPHIVTSDAILLERILRNLVSNAIRYTPAGEVAVTATLAGDGLRIEVRDTGIGIRAEDHERIFEEFLQIGNPGRTSKKGLGLGLSIVQRLCGLLEYRINVISEYGKGSAFSFEVPISRLEETPVAREPGAVHAAADLTGKLIVVIDDESAIIEGMQVLLAGWGAEVIGSTTGDNVVAAVHAAGKLPALLIVDHRLGTRENGIEVAQRIRRELDPEIPGILVTGSMTPELDALARASNLGFLLKPVMAEELRRLIGEMRGIKPPAATKATTTATSV